MISEIQNKLTCNKVDRDCFHSRNLVKNNYLVVYFSGDTGAITMSLSKSDIYRV